MKYLFGPVYSRRFGLSLGIDLSPEKKVCNFDCLYCELERAKPVENMENPPPVEEILSELKDFLSKNNYPDVITITANGEPTLYPYLDRLVDEINNIKGKSKSLILSNGSTIHIKKVRQALKKLDIVKLSLDAVNDKTFYKIDRPVKSISVEKIVEGIKQFRKEYKGYLVIEVLLVKYVNDNEENIKELANVLREIKPDRVDLGTVDRPPAYRVFPVSNHELLKYSGYFHGLNINVVERKFEKSYQFDLTEEEILNTVSKRPITQEDIENTFSLETKKIFEKLLKEGKVKKIENQNGIFYTKEG